MLKEMNLEEFTLELASASPAPGGGSASGVAGALAASLSTMVMNLTIGKPVSAGYSEEWQQRLRAAKAVSDEARGKFLELMEDDTKGFLNYMAAIKLPKTTDEEILHRKAAIEAAKQAVLEVPRTIALEAVKLYDAIETASQIGNPSALSDAGVASLLLDTAVKGAVYNVKINLPMVKDETLKKTLFEEAEKLTAMSIERSGGIFRHVTDTLNRQI